MWQNALSNFRSFFTWNGLDCWYVFTPIELLLNCLNLGFLFSQKKKKAKKPKITSCSERLILQIQVEPENETISCSGQKSSYFFWIVLPSLCNIFVLRNYFSQSFPFFLYHTRNVLFSVHFRISSDLPFPSQFDREAFLFLHHFLSLNNFEDPIIESCAAGESKV